MAANSYQESTFDFPNTFAGLQQIYHVVNSVGMSSGHAAHSHSGTVEICFIAKGSLLWWIGDSIFEVHSGDVLVMMPEVPHGSADSTLQPCEYFALHINPDRLPAEIRDAVWTPGFGGRHEGHSEAGELMRRIYLEHVGQTPYASEACYSLLTLLVLTLARSAKEAQESSPENYLVLRATRILSNEEPGTFTVEDLANRLKVSSVWLTKVFRQETGQAPGAWIRSQRLKEAKRLLLESDESIIMIAIRLGFASSQYFSTAFRHDTGLSPSEYRRRFAQMIPSAERELKA